MADERLDILLERFHRRLVRQAGRLDLDETVRIYLAAVPARAEGIEDALSRALGDRGSFMLLDCSGGPGREEQSQNPTRDSGVSRDEKMALFGRS